MIKKRNAVLATILFGATVFSSISLVKQLQTAEPTPETEKTEKDLKYELMGMGYKEKELEDLGIEELKTLRELGPKED